VRIVSQPQNLVDSNKMARLPLKKVSSPSTSRTGQKRISSKYSSYGCLRIQTSCRAYAFARNPEPTLWLFRIVDSPQERLVP
jgi:hypothetical protein